MFRKALNNIVTKIKKEGYEIDVDIPLIYLLLFILGKIFSGVYGMISLRSLYPIYRNRNTLIKCKSKIYFGRNVQISRGCIIDGLSHEGIHFGNNVSIGLNTTILCSGSLKSIGKGIRIGNNVGLGTNGFYGGAGGVEIGDDTIFGNFVSIHPENHNYDNDIIPIRQQGVNHKGIRIGNNCWIGAKATILDGTILGDGCIVAAGAVVTGIFPGNSIVGGVPAKIIKTRI